MKNTQDKILTSITGQQPDEVMNSLANISNQLESIGAPTPEDNSVQAITGGGGGDRSLTDASMVPSEIREFGAGNNFNASQSTAMSGMYGSALARNRAASAPARDLLPSDIERKENKFLKTMKQLEEPMSSKKEARKIKKAEKTQWQIDNKKEGYDV
mgnify:FL=1|jgi:hypothetical protein|tara:strand:+ start:2159 stop:2629 length:471 start_codon:yes stop_codon:yes gene_type:complete